MAAQSPDQDGMPELVNQDRHQQDRDPDQHARTVDAAAKTPNQAAEPEQGMDSDRKANDLEIQVVGGALRFAKRKQDRKSTRLNSSHLVTSYAVFCMKKKRKDE